MFPLVLEVLGGACCNGGSGEFVVGDAKGFGFGGGGSSCGGGGDNGNIFCKGNVLLY